MNRILAIDAWLIERVAQPVVDAVWAKIGVSRGTICRMLLFLWGLTIFTYMESTPLRLISLVLFALFFWLFEFGERNGWPGETMVLWPTRILQIALLIIFTPAAPFTFSYPIVQSLFIAFLYFAATKNPPPRKRKNWKEAMEKFAAQWTWLPARQGA